LLVQGLTLLLVSNSELEVPRTALRERYSSFSATRTSDTTSALSSQPTIPRLALFSIPSTPPLQPAESLSTIASTSTTNKDKVTGSPSKLLLKITPILLYIVFIPTNITATKGKVIYKQKKLACLATYNKNSKGHRTHSKVLFEYFIL